MIRKTLKHILKLAKRILFFFFSFVILYLFTAWICSNIATTPKEFDLNKNKIIYATSNGVHTDLIIPIESIHKSIIKNLQLKPNTKYVAFGWGDKGFYLDTPTWGDLTFSTAFNAVFLKSDTAMHITEYPEISKQWIKVNVCTPQIEILNTSFSSTFQIGVNNTFLRIKGHSYGNNDAFYEANGKYSCLKTCNTWTNQVLKKAEIKTSIWTPFDSGILKHL